MDNNELYHWGIKGMKWGVRRYQNADGSLTNAGEKRYGSGKSIGQTIKDYKISRRRKKNLEKARAARVAKKEAEKERSELIAKGKIRPKDMTQDEINERIARLESERRLKQLEKETIELSSGKQFVNRLIKDVITPAAVNSGRDFLQKALTKYGEGVLKDVDSKNPRVAQRIRIDKLKDDLLELETKKKIDELRNPSKSKNKFDLDKMWKNRNDLSDKEIQDLSQRLSNEQKIENIINQRKKNTEKNNKKTKNDASSKSEEKNNESDKTQNKSSSKKSNDTESSRYESWNKNTVEGQGMSQFTRRKNDTVVDAEEGVDYWIINNNRNNASMSRAANSDAYSIGQNYIFGLLEDRSGG